MLVDFWGGLHLASRHHEVMKCRNAMENWDSVEVWGEWLHGGYLYPNAKHTTFFASEFDLCFDWLGPLERANISIENHGTAKPTTPQSKEVQHLMLPLYFSAWKEYYARGDWSIENTKYQILSSSKCLTFYNMLRHATSMLPFRRLAQFESIWIPRLHSDVPAELLQCWYPAMQSRLAWYQMTDGRELQTFPPRTSWKGKSTHSVKRKQHKSLRHKRQIAPQHDRCSIHSN